MSCFESFDCDDSQGRVIEGGARCRSIFLKRPGRDWLQLINPSGAASSKSLALNLSSRSSGFTCSRGGPSMRRRETSSARPGRQRVDLTSSEFDLLMAFVRHPGQPLSRAALLGVLRGRQWTYFDRSIDTMVARLRKKLDDGSDRSPLIRSVRGVGYVFCAAVARLGDQDRSVTVTRLTPRDGSAPLPAL
jgi:DNA-binding response OmpR family regulator